MKKVWGVLRPFFMGRPKTRKPGLPEELAQNPCQEASFSEKHAGRFPRKPIFGTYAPRAFPKSCFCQKQNRVFGFSGAPWKTALAHRFTGFFFFEWVIYFMGNLVFTNFNFRFIFYNSTSFYILYFFHLNLQFKFIFLFIYLTHTSYNVDLTFLVFKVR